MNSFDDERFYVYFICDPSKRYENISDFTLTNIPFYCGKGTFSRIKSKKNKAVNDKIKSMNLLGITPEYVWVGPFTEEVAFELEKYFVDKFKRRDLFEDGVLLNLQDGGKGGFTPSLETRQKQSKSHKGKSPWNKGLKGAQIAWNKDIPLTEKQKEKLSKSLFGKIPWNKDIKYKLGEKTKNSKSVVINGIKYCSIREASEKTGMSPYIIKKNYLKESTNETIS